MIFNLPPDERQSHRFLRPGIKRPACSHTFGGGTKADARLRHPRHRRANPPSLSTRFSIALQSEFRRADSESPLIVEALLFDLVSRHLNIIRDRSSAGPRWLGSLLDYLDDTFEQEWSLQNMAAEMGVHPVYLCRAFSEHFDCTLGGYIRKQRVLRAWQLLAIGDSSLAEIASQSGFADQSHFTRAFKNHFGITPGEWRRQGSPDMALKKRYGRNAR
jgi:AraC-like DNA-binding protein